MIHALILTAAALAAPPVTLAAMYAYTASDHSMAVVAAPAVAPAGARSDDGPGGEYGVGARCIGFQYRAPAGLPVTPPEAPLPVELHIGGERRGWLYTCCGVDDARCVDIPSGAIARELGVERDCGDVNAIGLAACLGVELSTPTNYQLFVRTGRGG